ncbi:MAG: hypothetical protein M1826_003727 [Phylliscum demangeonii]|nr:MAG: hypothetical protein M1826_003727 [Phylliscum demangeonii]
MESFTGRRREPRSWTRLAVLIVPTALAVFLLRSAIVLHKPAPPSIVVRDGSPSSEGANHAQSADDSTAYLEYANATLLKRDQYACKKGTHCKTVACCGSFGGTTTGECGFGPTFCGADCDSQCNAHAECGQFADPPGKKCPLNVCCSEFGFCGTTSDFCGKACQSNCVLNPPVPAGASPDGILKRVIGYYESWSTRRSCHAFLPSALPVEGLTNVNFAFGGIDPSSLQITPMDSDTPASLFQITTDVRNLKTGNADLEVWISIGGWTFSDDGTPTQPVFPAIAADPQKRQTFADNLVSFMRQYGFDGVDLDWEYPGAPDRGGGGTADIQNYVALLRTLRSTFDASPRGHYGLSFTAPSSFWYMRWFDIPSMLKYADWVNFMTYDLHGIWDSNNPIGSQVLAHTNLTEIKLAVDLLWRGNVRPGQVNLGLGFYGRSFQLGNVDCAMPGCPFRGPAAPGDCTASAGTLGYFEIMDIINREKPQVVHDSDAAAKYFQYGDQQDQWVSYDDAVTFKQKVDWAKSVGLGGSLIWAVDLDDSDFSALSGLVGKSLPSFAAENKRSQVSETGSWSSLNGQKCFMTDCHNDPLTPGAGFATAPNVRWRTISEDILSDRCHAFRMSMAWQRILPWPGMQAFCCVANTWSALVDKCGYANHCDPCPSDAPYAVSTRSIDDGLFSSCTQSFCCPYNFGGCHWVGVGTCDDNECSATDVEVGLDVIGDTGSACAWGLSGRRKSLCCNTPSNLNPFLPVSLDLLFPTPPPTSYVPGFDLQPLQIGGDRLQGADEVLGPFGLVVIDGPPGTVTNLAKRDAAPVEFLSRGSADASGPHVVRFVCVPDPIASSCDDVYGDGVPGTILRMPDHQGFATYVVAHTVAPATDQELPTRLRKRAGPDARVWELEYSYDFSKVKRDSGPVYVRIDYSNNHEYYNQIVAANPQKRSLERRFWSKSSSVWKSLLSGLRSLGSTQIPALIKKDRFDVLIYGNDGTENNCGATDGFLRVGLRGILSNEPMWGLTLVGTIAPTLSLEEAYGFFDSNLYMSGTLDFDGKGTLKLDPSATQPLFSSPLTDFEFSHPGIVSFSPQLNADIQMLGSGEIDGKFSVDFEGGSSQTMTTHAPPGLGDFTGAAQDQQYASAFKGDISIPDPQFSTVFAININLEASLQLKVFGYASSLEDAGAMFTSRTPHVIRVVGNTGPGTPGVLDADLQASSEVFQTGIISSTWDDFVTHAVGRQPRPALIHSGNSAPPGPRQVPDIRGYPLFGGRDFVDCSNPALVELNCTWNIVGIDPSLPIDPTVGNPPAKARRSIEDLLHEAMKDDDFRKLDKRAGATGQYTQHNLNGNGEFFNWITPTYPSGNQGADLQNANGHREVIALAHPNDCTDTSILDDASTTGPNAVRVATEHPVERVTLVDFGEYVQRGTLDLLDGNPVFRTQLPLLPFNILATRLNQDYRTWPNAPAGTMPPGSAAADLADAFGSKTNPGVLANLEENMNGMKARVWSTYADPTADAVFTALVNPPTMQHTADALSLIRSGLATFNYINDNNIHQYIVNIHEGARAALNQFDTLYNRVYRPATPVNAEGLWTEFINLWAQRMVNRNRTYATARLEELEAPWRLILNNPQTPVTQRAVAQAQIQRIGQLRAQIPIVVVFNRNGLN